MKTKVLGILVMLGGVLLIGRPLLGQTNSLAGSWQFTLTASSPAAGSPISALATFTSDGSMIETDTSEVASLSSSAKTDRVSTAGHGIWQPAPAYGNLYIQFISLIANPDGTLYARKTVTFYGAMDSSG